MKDLFIEFDNPRFPVISALTAARNAVVAAMKATEEPKKEIQQAKGERKPEGHEKYLECECVFEAAGIKLSLANDKLLSDVATLHEVVAEVQRALDNPTCDWGVTRSGLAKLNVRCALELADRATALHYHLRRRWLDLDRTMPYCIHIGRAYKEGPALKSPREFVVMASMGGSSFRFDRTEDPSVPPAPPYMTFNEAIYDAMRFVRSFDLGDARIYNVRTKEVIPLKREWFQCAWEDLPSDQAVCSEQA
jgi:hypothetical protein